MAVVLGNRSQLTAPDVPLPAVQAPVDVMGEVVSVIQDIRAMRTWLASEEARTT